MIPWPVWSGLEQCTPFRASIHHARSCPGVGLGRLQFPGWRSWRDIPFRRPFPLGTAWQFLQLIWVRDTVKKAQEREWYIRVSGNGYSLRNVQRLSWRAQEALTVMRSAITHLSKSLATNEPMAPNLAWQNSFNPINGSVIVLKVDSLQVARIGLGWEKKERAYRNQDTYKPTSTSPSPSQLPTILSHYPSQTLFFFLLLFICFFVCDAYRV